MKLSDVLTLDLGEEEGSRGERKCFSAELKIACVTECSRSGSLLYIDLCASMCVKTHHPSLSDVSLVGQSRHPKSE